jgi:hypothetical protein
VRDYEFGRKPAPKTEAPAKVEPTLEEIPFWSDSCT